VNVTRVEMLYRAGVRERMCSDKVLSLPPWIVG